MAREMRMRNGKPVPVDELEDREADVDGETDEDPEEDQEDE